MLCSMAGATERGRDPDRRQALLDAADRVIRRAGPRASMAAIAAEAGITKPILYRHFGDKNGLYQALAERHTITVIRMIRAEFVTAGGDPRGRARAVVDAYLDTISGNVNLHRFLSGRPGTEDNSRARTGMAAIVRGVGEELGTVLSEDAAADPLRARILGHAVVGMIQAAGDWWLENPDVDRCVVADRLVDVIVAAMDA
jgi:AcrR family transcriptional regulator